VWNDRAVAPDPASRLLCRTLRSPEVLEPAERQSGADARKPRTQDLRVDEDTVVTKDVRQTASVLVDGLLVGFEPHVAVANEGLQEATGLRGERCRRLKACSKFRSVDSEQSHPNP